MKESPSGYSFPIARKVFAFARRARANWLLRHQNAFNFWIHMLGIPLALLAAPVLLLLSLWLWAAIAFVIGYLLQFIGHRVEGNDVGEAIPIKRLLGLPVLSIAPQYLSPEAPQQSENPQVQSSAIPPA